MTARRSILIIDDERGTREAMGKFLRLDYDITLAEDGEKGINLLNRNHYDLILSDIRMEPGPSGLDVLAASLKLSPPRRAFSSPHTAPSKPPLKLSSRAHSTLSRNRSISTVWKSLSGVRSNRSVSKRKTPNSNASSVPASV